MRCLKCNYDLNHHRSNRCPECGTVFDPLLSETYKPDQTDWRYWLPPRWMGWIVLFLLLMTIPAIIVPRYTVAHEGRTTSSLSYLQTLRSQLELYKHQHNGNYPKLQQLQSWDILTLYTDEQGNTATVKSAEYTYGPYLQQPFVNPHTNSSRVVGPDQATMQAGWVYDEKTGQVWFVVDEKAAEQND